MTAPRRGPGRPKLENDAEDAALLQAWRDAQAGGASRRAFAEQRAMTMEELERVIQRASKRAMTEQPRQ